MNQVRCELEQRRLGNVDHTFGDCMSLIFIHPVVQMELQTYVLGRERISESDSTL